MGQYKSFCFSACNPIADCMVPTCTSNADVTCKLCRSEFNSEKAGSNAFIGNPSNRHKCESNYISLLPFVHDFCYFLSIADTFVKVLRCPV